MDDERIIKQTIEGEMKKSYLDYSMSVIVSRALPDVRDGLKPVHRRILYAMNELGLPYNRPHKKSARVVGEVLGKYHPHGDSAAYESMVRMAQPFSLRYPLVDGQGNFGSMDGDPPAAMRYTEARLTRIASDLLADIDKNTVDFVDNFDSSLKEPSLLPAKFPNLLVNGSDGIAVGMATKMPPHNLCEVCDAISYTIDNPEATVMDLMQFVKGPDFPTGGTIYGLSEIISAYETGRGKLKIRANTHFEYDNGKRRIIVDELPYQVNKANLVEKIADLVKDKVLEGISDLRDESDRRGMRVVIEIQREAIPEVVLENLFKKTNMQISYGVINLALVNNRPMLLGLKDIIRHYIEYRKEIVTRATQYDLEQAEKRYHILEGLMAAINMLDETIALIRESSSGEEANQGLQGLLSIDFDQAKAILDLRLHKLTGLELNSVREEHANLAILMEDLRDILANTGRVYAIIKEELASMKDTYGDERRTVINEMGLEFDEEDLIPREDVVITISKDSYIKRIPLRTYREQNRGGVGLIGMQTKEEDHVETMFVSSSHDYIIFITNQGRLHWTKGYRLPVGSRQSKGRPIVNLLDDLDTGEAVQCTIHASDFSDDKSLILCTKLGFIQKTSLSSYGKVRRAVKCLRIRDDDELIEAAIADKDDQILLATRTGQVARFNPTWSAEGRGNQGVRGMRLNDGDHVVSMAIVRPGDKLLTVSEGGMGKVSDVDDYRETNRGAKGVKSLKASDRIGVQSLVSIRRVEKGDQLLITTVNGKMIRIKVDDIRETGRVAVGVKLMDMRDGDIITAVQPVVAEEEEDLEGFDIVEKNGSDDSQDQGPSIKDEPTE